MEPSDANRERIEKLEQELQTLRKLLSKFEERIQELEGPRRRGVVATATGPVRPNKPTPKPTPKPMPGQPPHRDCPPPPSGPQIS